MRAIFFIFAFFLLFGCIEEAPVPPNETITENKTEIAPPQNITPAPDIKNLSYLDLAYANVSQKNRLDLFLPEKGKGPYPLIIYIHGGGWISGSRKGCEASFLTKYGYMVACPSYRLSTEAKFPAQIHDVKAAIRWLRANAGKYDLDPNRFGVWGPSAGGHLTALVGTSGGVPAIEGNVGVAGSSRVQAAVDWFGPTDFLAKEVLNMSGKVDMNKTDIEYYGSNEKTAATFLIGGQLTQNPEKVKAANPIIYVSPDDPPFLVIHGTADGTVPYNQSVILYEALNDSGVDVTFITAEGLGHGWDLPDDPYMNATIEFFNKHLKKKN